MSDWGGFSDADLQKLKAQNEPKTRPKVVKPIKKPTQVTEKQRRPRKPSMQNKQTTPRSDVPPQAMLSQPKTPATMKASTTDSAALHGDTNVENKPTEVETTKAVKHEVEIIDDEDIIHEKEKLKLEDVTRRQKEMEEKNRRKRAMLSKAITERKKKASAESVKLIKIQAELAKLDENLSFDVSILRDKIDEACYSYNQAKKHFEHAEAAYISAKMELHKHTEQKEELTEHLYHVIQLNEERKAKKLEELMDKLDLEEVEDVEVKNDVVKEEKEEEKSSKAENKTPNEEPKVPEAEEKKTEEEEKLIEEKESNPPEEESKS